MATKSFFDRQFTRRDAVRLGLYGLGVTTGLPRFFQHTASYLAADEQSGAKAKVSSRNLVVVALTGGNDGLNTIIPFADDAYYRKRPTIGIPAAKVRKIDDHFGFHP